QSLSLIGSRFDGTFLRCFLVTCNLRLLPCLPVLQFGLPLWVILSPFSFPFLELFGDGLANVVTDCSIKRKYNGWKGILFVQLVEKRKGAGIELFLGQSGDFIQNLWVC